MIHLKAGQQLLSVRGPARQHAPQPPPPTRSNPTWAIDDAVIVRADAELRSKLLSWQPEGSVLHGSPNGQVLPPLPARFANMEEYVRAFSTPLFAELYEDVRAHVAQAAASRSVGVACEVGSVNSGTEEDELLVRIRVDPHSMGWALPNQRGRKHGSGHQRQQQAEGHAGSGPGWFVHDLLLLTPCETQHEAQAAKAAEHTDLAKASLPMPPPPPPPPPPRQSLPPQTLPPNPPRAQSGGRWEAQARAQETRPQPVVAEMEDGELVDEAPSDPRQRRPPAAPAAASVAIPLPLLPLPPPPPPPPPLAALVPPLAAAAQGQGAEAGAEEDAPSDPRRKRPRAACGLGATAPQLDGPAPDAGRAGPGLVAAPQPSPPAPTARCALALVLRAAGSRGDDFATLAVRECAASGALLSGRESSHFRLRALSLGSVATALREHRALSRVGAFPLLQALLPRPPRPEPQPPTDPRRRPAEERGPGQGQPQPQPQTQPQTQAQPQPQPPSSSATGAALGSAQQQQLELRVRAHLGLLASARGLNRAQTEALSAAARLRVGVELIVGPPGTGKSSVVLALLNLLHTHAYGCYYARLLAEACRPGSFLATRTPALAGAAPLPSGTSASALADGAASAAAVAAAAAAAAAEEAVARLEADAPRLLVCAPSNIAVDELLARAMSTRFLDGGGQPYAPDVLRVGGGASSAEAQAVSVEQRADSYLGLLLADPPAALRELGAAQLCVDASLRELRLSARQTQLRFVKCGGRADSPEWAAERDAHAGALTSAWEPYRRNLLALRRLRIGTDPRLTRAARRQQLRALELGSAHLVFATLASAGTDLLGSCGRHFPTVVVDEACQATEPAALVALQYGARRALLVGDPAQLPATVLSRGAEQCGYGRSLFERLHSIGSHSCALDVQYRMHPAIAHFPAARFYGGRIVSPPSVDPRERPPPPMLVRLSAAASARGEPFAPYAFYDVPRGREVRAGEGGLSLANPLEAQACAQLVAALLQASGRAEVAQTGGEPRSDAPSPAQQPRLVCGSVAMLTPYAAQVPTLRAALAAHPQVGRECAALVEVCTIDSFQGREKDCVIFSAVRAPAPLKWTGSRIGFVSDVRRMNVALTRARHAMWIVGHAGTLENGSPDWAALVNDARERNVFFSPT